MSNSTPSRRHFLKVLGAGSAVLGAGAIAGCDDAAEPVVGDVAAGNVSGLPVGTLRAVGEQAVAIGRDAAGVYSMTLICTHEQCNMAVDGDVTAQGATCNCHESRFDANGGVQQGPATSPLDHYEVVIDGNGEITIHAGKVVSADTRTPVPGPA